MDTQNEHRESTPTLGIKDKYLEQLHSDFPTGIRDCADTDVAGVILVASETRRKRSS